jgi:hypothetical protein
MSNTKGTASHLDSDQSTQRAARPSAIQNPLGSRGDPISSENIDAQIRWFFENALERKPPNP